MEADTLIQSLHELLIQPTEYTLPTEYPPIYMLQVFQNDNLNIN